MAYRRLNRMYIWCNVHLHFLCGTCDGDKKEEQHTRHAASDYANGRHPLLHRFRVVSVRSGLGSI